MPGGEHAAGCGGGEGLTLAARFPDRWFQVILQAAAGFFCRWRPAEFKIGHACRSDRFTFYGVAPKGLVLAMARALIFNDRYPPAKSVEHGKI